MPILNDKTATVKFEIVAFICMYMRLILTKGTTIHLKVYSTVLFNRTSNINKLIVLFNYLYIVPIWAKQIQHLQSTPNVHKTVL